MSGVPLLLHHRSVDGQPDGHRPGRAGKAVLARRAALLIAAARLALGLAAVAVPTLVARPWIGVDAERPGPQVFGRALGGRDLALGLGALLAARRGRPIRGWVEAGALADLVDVAATATAFGDLPRRGRWVVLTSAATAALAGAAAARAV